MNRKVGWQERFAVLPDPYEMGFGIFYEQHLTSPDVTVAIRVKRKRQNVRGVAEKIFEHTQPFFSGCFYAQRKGFCGRWA